jgi:hypothetical protein
MAKIRTSSTGKQYVQSKPHKSAQGRSNNTNRAATSKRGRQKRYRGQGR